MPRPPDGPYVLKFLNGEGVEEERTVSVQTYELPDKCRLIVPPAWNGPLDWYDDPPPGGFYRAAEPEFVIMFDYPSVGQYTAQVGDSGHRYSGPYRRA